MNEEAQELLNRQFDKRITKLEDTIDNIQLDLQEMKCDMKMLVNTTNKLNERWEEFDKQQRKNKNEIIMKIVMMVVGAVATLMLTKLGLS